MSKASKRRNEARDAKRSDERELSHMRLMHLEDRARTGQLTDQEMWEYATALAPIGATTLRAYEQSGMSRHELIANRTLGVDFYWHLKQELDFSALAVEGSAWEYTVSILLPLSDAGVSSTFKRADDSPAAELGWKALDENKTGMPQGVGHFLGWLNACAYAQYVRERVFRDVHD